jgi:glycosyltransferase involved in cell wall biosynthesis
MNLLEKRGIMEWYTGRRGLFSVNMINALYNEASNYDCIISGVMPFTGVIYPAMKSAGKFNKKFILLPLIHFGQISERTNMNNFQKGMIFPEQYRYEYFSDSAMKMYEKADVIITQGVFEENFVKQNTKSAFVRVNPKIEIPKEIKKQKNEGFTILTMANHNFEKGIDTTLNAFKMVKKSAPDAKLIIAGAIEGEYRCSAESVDGVEITGHLDEDKKREIFSRADLFVLPSIAESLGIVTLEAHAYGVPTINAYCSGSMQIVKNGFNGFLVPFQDYLLTYEYIMTLYRDGNLLDKMKANARQTAIGEADLTDGYGGGGFSAKRQEKQIKNLMEIL